MGLNFWQQNWAVPETAVILAGSLCLVLLAAAPTLQQLRSGPSRLPYDTMERAVLTKEGAGMPAYAVWYYGVGEPINYYCRRACVQEMPSSDAALPDQLLLLYRPSSKDEASVYRRLLQEGYVVENAAYFTDGMRSTYGTSLTTLARREPTSAGVGLTRAALPRVPSH